MRRRTTLIFMMTTVAASAHAETTPAAVAAGEGAYQRARAAWDRGDFGAAEPLYKEALTLGGLAADETNDAYVRLGSARAVMGRKQGALAAFREAAFASPTFTVPSEAGRKAVQLAVQAKKEEAKKVGALALRVEAPDSSPAGKPFRVEAKLDATQVAIVPNLSLFAREITSDSGYTHTEPSGTSVVFEVPASVTGSKGTILVRLAALDVHENRLVSVERKVTIEGPPAPATTPGPIAAVSEVPSLKDNDKPKKDAADKKSAGFWSTPWPYVIGGFALAAGGAAVFFVTRPSDDVTVGAPRVAVR